MRRLFRVLGRTVLGASSATGALALVSLRAAAALPRADLSELRRALVQFGYGSLSLTLVTAAVTGATVVLQTGLYVQRFGARSFLGWAAGYAVLWEFGPLLLGLVMAARLGARNAAELAALQVGGQLEGLRGIALEPYALLISPRIVAMVASLTGLSTLAFFVAIVFESLAAHFTLALPARAFFDSFALMLGPRDVAGGIIKCAAFGLAIALVSTAVGLRARGGARAVGQAAATAVVESSAAIFLLDFLLTSTLFRLFA